MRIFIARSGGQASMGWYESSGIAFAGKTRPPDDLQSAADIFGQGRAAFNPIAVVAVENAADVADFRVVDMAAHHAIDMPLAGFARQGFLEIGNERGGVLHLEFQIGRQRPIGEPEAAAHRVQHVVEHEREGVGGVAQMREPARIGDDAVEMIAVNDQHPAAVGGFMDRLLADFDARQRHAAITAKEFVVIAGNVDDAGAFLDLVQNGVEHARVCVVPEPAFLQPPAVDDIADEIERLAIVVREEVGQKFGFAAARAEMGVRDKERAMPFDPMRRRFRQFPGALGFGGERPIRGFGHDESSVYGEFCLPAADESFMALS
jgi:hypothetical protein